MKKPHRLSSQTAGPVWGLALGALMTVVGTGLWFYAQASRHPVRFDKSVAVAAVLIGGFLATYAAREIYRDRRR